MAKPQFNHAITYLSTPCGNHPITYFRGTDKTISTTTHNLLAFNISEVSLNNSVKLSLLADKTSGFFSYTRLIQVPGCKVTRTGDQQPVFTPGKKLVLARVKVHLQFCSHLIHLTPKSLFPRPKTWWSPLVRKANNIVPFCLSPDQGD